MKKEVIKCMLINNFEIGSEFSYDEHNHGEKIILPKLIEDYTYTFSGRTAIETVLKNEIGIKKALLPSYCCDSMIVPFRKHGIKVVCDHRYDEKDMQRIVDVLWKIEREE